MNPEAAAKLTPEQIETLELVHEYRTDKKIAQVLRERHPENPIGHHAVKERLRRARRVLGASDRWQAADTLLKYGALTPYPQRVYPPPPLPDEGGTVLNIISNEERLSAPSIVQELRDGVLSTYDPSHKLPQRRWPDWLFRRRGERFNDLSAPQTIVAIIVALTLMAFSAFMVTLAMSTWR